MDSACRIDEDPVVFCKILVFWEVVSLLFPGIGAMSEPYGPPPDPRSQSDTHVIDETAHAVRSVFHGFPRKLGEFLCILHATFMKTRWFSVKSWCSGRWFSYLFLEIVALSRNHVFPEEYQGFEYFWEGFPVKRGGFSWIPHAELMGIL